MVVTVFFDSSKQASKTLEKQETNYFIVFFHWRSFFDEKPCEAILRDVLATVAARRNAERAHHASHANSVLCILGIMTYCLFV